MSAPETDGAQPFARMPQVGDLLDRYELTRKLGAGGMGAVFEGVDRSAHLVRAIKVLPIRAGPEMLQRFAREGQAMGRVPRHSHVVQVMHGGQTPACRFLVMELARGSDLAGRLSHGPIDPDEAARWARDLADALAHVHAHGVLHRDLKPGNVVFDDDGRAMLTDFGLAAVADTRSLTESGTLMGTPAYMAPEQALCEELDARTDVYGLGAILYFMLTGRAPFQGGSTLRLLSKVAEGDFPPAREVNPTVPAELDAICARAMATARGDRYPDAVALRDDLDRWLAGEAPRVPSASASASASSAAGWVAAAAALVAVIGLAAAFAAQGAGPPAETLQRTPTPPSAPKPDPTGSPAAESLLEQARAAVARGDGPQALVLLRKCVKQQPNTAAAWQLLSEVALVLYELDEARRAGERAAELVPRDAEVAVLLMRIAVHQRRSPEAQRWLAKAEALGPTRPHTKAARWYLRAHAWDRKKALREGERVLESAPGVAWVLERLGVYESRPLTALRAYDRALKLTPFSVNALLARGNLHLVLGKIEAAEQDLARLKRLRPGLGHVIALEARVRCERNDGAGALELAKRLEALGGDRRVVAVIRGTALNRLERFSESNPLLRSAHQILPNVTITLELARSYLGLNRPQPALALLTERVVDFHYEGPIALGFAVLLGRGDVKGAEAALEEYRRRGGKDRRNALTLEYNLAVARKDLPGARRVIARMTAELGYSRADRLWSEAGILYRMEDWEGAKRKVLEYRALKGADPKATQQADNMLGAIRTFQAR